VKAQLIEPVFYFCDFVSGQGVVEMFGYIGADLLRARAFYG
jgi:hypothetical protein